MRTGATPLVLSLLVALPPLAVGWSWDAGLLGVGQSLGEPSVAPEVSIRLEPFDQPLLFGRVQARAMVESSDHGTARIARLVFSVDGVEQVTLERPPWTARLRLPPLPEPAELVVEAFDQKGTSLARDRRLLNAGFGDFSISVRSPAVLTYGENRVVLDVDVPRSEAPPRVTLSLAGKELASLDGPPYVAIVEIEEPAAPRSPLWSA